MRFEPTDLPPSLVGITQVKVFVRPLSREQFDAAVEALGGRGAFARPRKYGVWTKDGATCVYPPARECNLPPALASLRR